MSDATSKTLATDEALIDLVVSELQDQGLVGTAHAKRLADLMKSSKATAGEWRLFVDVADPAREEPRRDSEA